MRTINNIKIATTVSSLLLSGTMSLGFNPVDEEVSQIVHSVNDYHNTEMIYDLQLQQEQKQQEELEKALQAEIEKQKIEFNVFINKVKSGDITKIDLREPSGLTVQLSNEILSGTGLEGLGSAFVKAEKEYGVNAYYLMAHAAWESQWGKSRLAKDKNNLFGYLAYDADPYNSAKTFSTKEESILTVAEYISSHYLNSAGDHFNGSNLVGMNVKYATDQSWAKGIGSIINQFVYEAALIGGI